MRRQCPTPRTLPVPRLNPKPALPAGSATQTPSTRAQGTATVYDLGPAGGRVLRLEDFRVTNGPDLRVLLANAPNPESHSDLVDAGYVELGKLKGNVGAQNYDIPSSISLADVHSLVIYCNPFRVVFSVATLEASSDNRIWRPKYGLPTNRRIRNRRQHAGPVP